MLELLTLGETMAALSAERIGPLRHAHHLALSIAGSESTVAIGASRLGRRTGWIGRVGEDDFGALVQARLRAEGVSVFAAQDRAAPTGLMIKERRTADRRRVHYYRTGSAGSRLEPEDLPTDEIASARILHLSAITLALSTGAAKTAEQAVHHARFVSFDANYRAALWNPADYRARIRALLPSVDLLFASWEEARVLAQSRTEDPVELAGQLLKTGPRTVVITMGRDGALSLDADAQHRIPAEPVTEIDPVGAGDAFVAGYLSTLLAGADTETCLRAAARVAAFCVAAEGDWEGLPTTAELALATAADISR